MPVLWIGGPGTDHVQTSGGKAASLSRLVRAGLPVPPGFVITTEAYRRLLREAGLAEPIRRLLQDVTVKDLARLEGITADIRRLLREALVPPAVSERVAGSYGELCIRRPDVAVAVRSSATTEDLAGASFAGQQDTFLGISGTAAVLERVRECWASLFTARAVMYRAEKGFDHLQAAMAVVVQELVEADKSGVMFTAHPVTRDRNTVVIEAVHGLGEALVSGAAVADHFTLEKATARLVDSFVFEKEEMLVRARGGAGTCEVPVPAHLRSQPVLTADELAQLVAMGRRLEDLFGHPQDVEWAFGDGRLYLLQSRPITTL